MMKLKAPLLNAIALCVAALLGSTAGFADHVGANHSHSDEEERLLVHSFKQTLKNNLPAALQAAETLVQENPEYRLGQLVYADLLAALSGQQGFRPLISDDKVENLREEALARWQHYQQHPDEHLLPANILRLGENQKHLIVIDTENARLYLYKNHKGQPRLVDDYYISIGKNGADKKIEGDKKTPLGVYHVTEYIPPTKLPDFYGAGAFPINYPNTWDRRLGKTGYGIWIHGNPLDQFSRPPLASDGCVTLTNPEMELLKRFVDVGRTPVIIASDVQWKHSQELHADLEDFENVLQQWRKDWESLDNGKYLSHYGDGFRSPRKNLKQWQAYKRMANSRKSYIRVKMENVSLYRYPGEDIVVVDYMQHYESSNYSNTSPKQLYWKKQDRAWKIIYEGPPS